MKKFLSVFISILLLSSLAACGGETNTVKDFAVEDAGTLLESGAFTESLTGIDTEVACTRYGVDPATVTSGAVYGSTGATAEELAVLTFDSAAHAEDAKKAVGYWLEDQIEAMASYLPLEVSKLEKTILEVRGASLLLVVANDYSPVDDFLK